MAFLRYLSIISYVLNVSESFNFIPASSKEMHTRLMVQNKDASYSETLASISTTTDRSTFLKTLSTASISFIVSGKAIADDTLESKLIVRSGKEFSYNFQPPSGFKTSNKPLKTHLDEINYTKDGERGYQYGITVDPVRINSLQEFGTPEQVAERVINAERDRDGITDVTLVGIPKENSDSKSYEISYISQG